MGETPLAKEGAAILLVTRRPFMKRSAKEDRNTRANGKTPWHIVRGFWHVETLSRNEKRWEAQEDAADRFYLMSLLDRRLA